VEALAPDFRSTFLDTASSGITERTHIIEFESIEARMRRYALFLVALVTIATVAAYPTWSRATAHKAAAQDKLQSMTVRGDIWDSVCARAGSHGSMMTKLHASTVKDCTLNCVKGGAELVLYSEGDKVVYRLDSQDKVKEYAGQVVTVIGNYDRATNILHVDRIETGM
jgi:hypothetical protein